MPRADFLKHLCLLQVKQNVEDLNITSMDLVCYSAYAGDNNGGNQKFELRPAWRVVQDGITEHYYDAVTGNNVYN